MNENSAYFPQAQLMTRVLPLVAKENCFALKGGTAICFFYRDLPRLSIDIDLTYLPIEEREKSLNEITSGLERISASAKKLSFKVSRTCKKQRRKSP